MSNSDHEEIYLEPLFIPNCEGENSWYDEGRQWCEDNVWSPKDYDNVDSTKYIRADLVVMKSDSKKSVDMLTEQNERLKKKLHAKYVQEELGLGRSFINAKKYADQMIEDLC